MDKVKIFSEESVEDLVKNFQDIEWKMNNFIKKRNIKVKNISISTIEDSDYNTTVVATMLYEEN